MMVLGKREKKGLKQTGALTLTETRFVHSLQALGTYPSDVHRLFSVIDGEGRSARTSGAQRLRSITL